MHTGLPKHTVCATLYRLATRKDRRHAPIGRPIANTRIYVLDGQGEPVPVGVAGETVHRRRRGGAGLSEPAGADGGAVRAGSVQCRRPERGCTGRAIWGGGGRTGTIEFLGRNDDQVKIRGFRIELGEIEARLAEHAGVREAVVLAREDDGGDKRLVAYYTAASRGSREEATRGGSGQRSGAVASASSGEAAGVHGAGGVRAAGALPLTANGKLDRKALPAPDGMRTPVQRYEAPQGETERKLAEIWAEVLKLERVGRHDNFFELGGHSLLATRLVGRVRSLLGVDLTIRTLFEVPSVAGLAKIVEVLILEAIMQMPEAEAVQIVDSLEEKQ